MGISRLYGVGDLSALAVASFGEGAKHFRSAEALADALIDSMHSGMVILVKGSRVMHMDRIVAGISRRTPTAAGVPQGGV
jgi:UDP-N-acetylmuramoyl-tripeptide--D-alanyl-D-alanine ligase